MEHIRRLAGALGQHRRRTAGSGQGLDPLPHAFPGGADAVRHDLHRQHHRGNGAPALPQTDGLPMSDTLSPIALMAGAEAAAPAVDAKPLHKSRGRADHLKARGEPFTWMLGGALALGCIMIVGLLLLVLWWG